MSHPLFRLLGCLFSLAPLITWAQNKSLEDHLLNLQKTFDVEFSYNSSLLRQVELGETDCEKLEDCLSNIEEMFPLSVEKIGDSWVVIPTKKIFNSPFRKLGAESPLRF